MVRIYMSPENPNSIEESDIRLGENGAWEKNGGREMTTCFAKAFVDHVAIPIQEPFTLLDIGCALGGSMPVFHAVYPQAQLSGCDISANAIRRCKEEYGQYATFFESSIDALEKSFDVMFCSNIIEHIENHVEIVRHLTTLAKIVYVMVPYNETNKGQRLNPQMGLWHVATFDEHTFDVLKNERMDIRTFTFRAPPFWGHPVWRIPLSQIKAALLGKPFVDKKQIVFELKKR